MTELAKFLLDLAVSSALVVNFVLQNYILPTVADETATRGVFWSKYKKILTIPPPGNIFWSKFGAKIGVSALLKL